MSFSFILILTFLFFSGNAQQNPGISLYSLNTAYLNPASVGFNGESHAQIHYRNQWTQYQSSYDGSGNLGTQIASLSLGFKDSPLGAGLLYMNDLTPSGVGLQFIRTQLAYHLEVGSGTLSVGTQIGLSSRSFDGKVFRVREPNDPLANELSGKSIAKSSLDLGLGLMYSREKWSLGASLDHLNAPTFAFLSPDAQTKLVSVLSVNGNANLDLSEQIVLNPFTQLRVYQGQLLLDVGMRIEFAKMFWVGGNFRTDDAFAGMLGFSVWKKKIDFGYAIDQTFSNQTIKAPLSHEFFIRFNLPSIGLKFKSNKPLPINTPRFKIN